MNNLKNEVKNKHKMQRGSSHRLLNKGARTLDFIDTFANTNNRLMSPNMGKQRISL